MESGCFGIPWEKNMGWKWDNKALDTKTLFTLYQKQKREEKEDNIQHNDNKKAFWKAIDIHL